MHTTEIHGRLKALKLFGMATRCDELLHKPERPTPPPEVWLRHLIEAEEAERKARSIRYQMGIAKFPLARDLDGFSFEDAQVERVEIETLHQGQFMAHAHNLLLVGGTGTGKTHLAIAIGRHAVRQGKRIRFFSVVDLVNLLKQEKASGRSGQLVNRLLNVDAVILDELGYYPSQHPAGPCCSI